MRAEPHAPPRVGILIVNYYSAVMVGQLLHDLASLPQAHCLCISIVDNSIDPEEAARLTALVKQCESRVASCSLTVSDVNTGYAGGNNMAFLAVAGANPEIVFVVNPDVRILEADFTDALETARRDARHVLVAHTTSPRGVSSGSASMSKLTGRSFHGRQMRSSRSTLTYPEGHFFGLSTRLWRASGGLDEEYFLYCEEVDFVLRNRITPPLIHECVGIHVFHAGAGTTGSSIHKSAATKYHANRSRIILFRRHAELRRFLPVLLFVRILYSVVDSIQRPRDLSALRGVIDGARAVWARQQLGGG